MPQVDAELRSREEALSALQNAADFLLTSDKTTSFQKYIDLIAPMAVADRIRVFINNRIIAQWPDEARTFPWELFKNNLERGQVVKGNTDDFSKEQRDALTGQNILAILMFPLYRENRLLGWVSFEQKGTIRPWVPWKEKILEIASHFLTQAALNIEEEDKSLAASLKNAEKALVESKKRFKSLADTVFGALFISENGICLDANQAALDMFGYTHEEFVGIFGADVMDAESQDLVKENMLKGYEGIYQAVAVKRNGERFPCEIRAKMVEMDGRKIRITALRDISDRRQSEVIIKSLAKSMVGVTGQECFDRIVTELSRYFNSNCAVVGQLTDRGTVKTLAMELDGEKVTDFEYPLKGTPSENTVVNGYSLFPSKICEIFPEDQKLAEILAEGYVGTAIINKKGKTIGILCAISTREIKTQYLWRDIMEILAARAAAEMDRMAAEEERRLLESRIKETQKLQSLGLMAGGIAHDFNNLLMAIMGNSDLARLDLPKDAPTHHYMDEIDNAAKNAAELCKQMLAYSGRSQFLIEFFNLSETLELMAESLKHTNPENIEIKCDIDKTLPNVEGDKAQIRRVMRNLVTNAYEAIGENKGRITLRTGIMDCTEAYLNAEVGEVPLKAGKYCFFEVCDTGCGMGEDTISKLFDPFFTTKFTGRGLGMAAAVGIVRGHKGVIKVDSRLGDGSAIRVLLPAHKEKAPSMPPQAAEDPVDGRHKRAVLVIDDDENVLQVCKDMLKIMGFTVKAARNGEEGLSIFTQETDIIDCILLDLTMPRMGGEACARQLRQISPSTPIILSSGYNETDVLHRFSGLKLSGFIQKPYTMSDLVKVLRQSGLNPKTQP